MLTLSLLSLLLAALGGGVYGDVTLAPPPACYAACLSNQLAAVGCSFADVALPDKTGVNGIVEVLLWDEQYCIRGTVDRLRYCQL